MKTDIVRSGSLSNEVRFMTRMTRFVRSGFPITLQLLCVLSPELGQKGSKRVIFWSFPGTRFLKVRPPSMPNEVVFGSDLSRKWPKVALFDDF